MTEQEIIDKAVALAVEKTLLMIPEVIGNLMADQAVLNKLNSQFYADNPEFRDHKQLVVSVLEELDGKNPGMKYEDILAKSIPEIKRRISLTKDLKMDSIDAKAKRSYEDFYDSGNGEI